MKKKYSYKKRITMSKGKVKFKKDDERYTPKFIVDIFGKFDYDPATTKEKAKEFDISSYDTIETNGLETDWTQFKRIWINPPFSIKHEFLKKGQETYDTVHNDIYIIFPIEFLITKKFNLITKGCGTIYLPDKRIAYGSGCGGTVNSPAFGSVIFKFSDKPYNIERLNLGGDLKNENT